MSALKQNHTILIDGIEVSLSFDVSKEAYEHHFQDLEPCDRDSQALDLASSLGGVAVSQLHEVASKLALSFSVQACKFLELGEAHTSLVNEEPQRDFSSASNENKTKTPFQMPVWQAAKIDKNLSKAASCALSIITSVQHTSAMYSDEQNALIQQERDAFEQTEIFLKAAQIEKLAEEALNLIKPTEVL